MSRILHWATIGFVGAMLAGWAVLWVRSDFVGQAIHSGTSAQIGGPFSLVDHTGTPVTEASWPGRWRLIFFGYTTCPDLCPTELQTIAAALDLLGNDAAQVVPIFITVDPERDTPALLAGYLKLFDDRLVGLTGTPRQIAAVAGAYRVYYAKVTPKDSTVYLMDHSSFLYLMGPDGTLRALLRPGTGAPELAQTIRSRLLAAR